MRDHLRRTGGPAALLVALGILIVSLLASPASAPPDADAGRPTAPAVVDAGSLPSVEPARTLPRAQRVRQGAVLATMTIPVLGARWTYPVIEGVRQRDLARGMTHYPGTALPGERGNAAFFGHRWDGPLYDFERVVPGSRIVIEQRGARWTYEVTTRVRRVRPDAVWIIDPVRGHEDERLLTLVTCWPKNGSSHREYVRARLIERDPS